MALESTIEYEPMLFGKNGDSGLVAVELTENKDGPDEMLLFVRRDGKTTQVRERFQPFVIATPHAMKDCPVAYDAYTLNGEGALNLCVVFESWADCAKAKKWLAKSTGHTASAPGAPYVYLSDPVQQHLMVTGRTQFLGMAFDDLRRLQVDIECYTTEGYSFCNAEREGDRIIAIAVSDNTGWDEVLSGDDEAELLRRFAACVRERDPDVIEGHNIFNFDLPYIRRRAKMHRVKLAIGRDGSVPVRRNSRFSAGGRTISYSRFDVFGRHVVDTLFLVHAYDASHRSLDGFGLKSVALHFGIAAKDRTYIEGDRIASTFDRDPETVLRYVRDDVIETRGISRLLSQSSFIQTQMLPFTYQNATVRGNATKIDALMVREYLRQQRALPTQDQARSFAGGYTDLFVEGVVEDVHHCDVRSLYPALMLTRSIAPANDELGVFLQLLDRLRTFRLDAKQAMRDCTDDAQRNHFDALQSTFKILINSFYGYLGFAQGRFNDFDAAEAVARGGRELLVEMISWLKDHGARPVEIDTDGIYFVPPADLTSHKKMEGFREAFATSLPEGIEIEFDGEFRSMFSYKMKNYALLTHDGETIVKGAALKSRGLEPFQRDFMRELIRRKLEGRDAEIPKLKLQYQESIAERRLPIEKLAKTETLQDSPATYAAKAKRGGRGRNAAYELALQSGREYRAGDQVSYYVTGEKKSVAVYEAARLVSEWNPERRDENVPYYQAKLDALYKKFGGGDEQPELALF